MVLAEEWQTVNAVLALDSQLRTAGCRERVALLWNANNLFGFDRIAWPELSRAAAVTTVSRMMRMRMEPTGVPVLVIPNGLLPEAFTPPDRKLVAQLRAQLRGRLLLAKVARWDPDKSWPAAVEGTRALKEIGRRPLLIARGGSEAYGAQVRQAASAAGLRWVDRSGPASLPDALASPTRGRRRVSRLRPGLGDLPHPLPGGRRRARQQPFRAIRPGRPRGDGRGRSRLRWAHRRGLRPPRPKCTRPPDGGSLRTRRRPGSASRAPRRGTKASRNCATDREDLCLERGRQPHSPAPHRAVAVTARIAAALGRMARITCLQSSGGARTSGVLRASSRGDPHPGSARS